MRSLPHRIRAAWTGRPDPRAELIQLLTPEGERTEHPDYPLDLTADEVKALYRDLVLVRRIDFEAIALQRQGELGIWASLLGQEAAQVGSGRALRPARHGLPDLPGARRGLVPRAWTRPSCWSCSAASATAAGTRRTHNFHLYTIVIGAQTLHATGYAMGIQRDGAVGEDGEAAIVYFGDGATSQGDVNEAFIWASVINAPVVFFCQNNQWAISEPLERQSRIPLYQRARGFGFPGVQVDGNDVFACLAVTRKAMQAAREGQGPTLIEAFTYRMGAHTTTDDPTRYRLASRARVVEAEGPDRAGEGRTWSAPGPPDAAFFDEVEAEADEVGSGSGRPAWRCPIPRRCRCSTTSTPSRPRCSREEREQFAAYLDSFVAGGGGAMTTLTLSKALNEGLRKALENDPKVLIMGEDVGKLGGVFRVTDGLQKDFGEVRVVDTPLAESGIVGTAIGLALRGYRPVCEIQFDGFVFPAFDQIVSQLAKMRDALAGPGRRAGDDQDPVRRRHRRGRAPQRVAGGAVRAHGGPAGGRLRRPGRRLHHDPAGDPAATIR